MQIIPQSQAKNLNFQFLNIKETHLNSKVASDFETFKQFKEFIRN